jgi:hypothetical protein
MERGPSERLEEGPVGRGRNLVGRDSRKTNRSHTGAPPVHFVGEMFTVVVNFWYPIIEACSV